MGTRGAARSRTIVAIAGSLVIAGVALLTAAPAVAAPIEPDLLEIVAVGDDPTAVAVSPDGRWIYVAAMGDDTVTVVDGTSYAAYTIPLANGAGPLDLVVNPANGHLLVLDLNDPLLGVAEIVEIIPGPGTPDTWGAPVPHPLPSGAAPNAIAITADGSKAYLADSSGAVWSVPTTGGWAAAEIDVATPTGVTPWDVAVAGAHVYVVDLMGGGGVAVIRIADDGVEPTAIALPDPPGTTGGVVSLPSIEAEPSGAGVIVAAPAFPDDPSATDTRAFLWRIPAGTTTGSAAYVGGGIGEDPLKLAITADGRRAYIADCSCVNALWTADLSIGSVASWYLPPPVDPGPPPFTLSEPTALALSTDGTRVFVVGLNAEPGPTSVMWVVGTVTDSVLSTTTGTPTVQQGGSAAFTVTGTDAWGYPIDVSHLVELRSSVPTDIVSGSTVTFPTASPHVITAYYPSFASAVASGAVTVQVTAALPPTGAEPAPWLAAAGALLIAGGLALGLSRAAARRTR